MLNIIKSFNNKYIDDIKTKFPSFKPGDTIRIGLKLIDENRVQEFEGVCIAIRNKSIGSNIVVQKESDGIKVINTIMIYSPQVSYIKVIRRAKKNKRAKLYYLFNKTGKKARIPSDVVSE